MAPLESIEAIDPKAVTFKPRGITRSKPDELTSKIVEILSTGRVAKLTFSGTSRQGEAYDHQIKLKGKLRNIGLNVQTVTEEEMGKTVLNIGLKPE